MYEQIEENLIRIFNCDTKEKYVSLLKALRDLGYTWPEDIPIDSFVEWNTHYNEETCVWVYFVSKDIRISDINTVNSGTSNYSLTFNYLEDIHNKGFFKELRHEIKTELLLLLGADGND